MSRTEDLKEEVKRAETEVLFAESDKEAASARHQLLTAKTKLGLSYLHESHFSTPKYLSVYTGKEAPLRNVEVNQYIQELNAGLTAAVEARDEYGVHQKLVAGASPFCVNLLRSHDGATDKINFLLAAHAKLQFIDFRARYQAVAGYLHAISDAATVFEREILSYRGKTVTVKCTFIKTGLKALSDLFSSVDGVTAEELHSKVHEFCFLVKTYGATHFIDDTYKLTTKCDNWPIEAKFMRRLFGAIQRYDFCQVTHPRLVSGELRQDQYDAIWAKFNLRFPKKLTLDQIAAATRVLSQRGLVAAAGMGRGRSDATDPLGVTAPRAPSL